MDNGSTQRESADNAGEASVAGDAVGAVLGALRRWHTAGPAVSVVGIDGPGASGKSTVAGRLASMLELSLVHTDDFFRPPSARRDRPASIGEYYDVARLRAEALEPLRAGRGAIFACFDWDSGALSDEPVHVKANEIVLVEGVYSASPELADLVDKVIFVATPAEERLRRLRGLIAPGDWDTDWLAAENEYFSTVRPMDFFDLVISGNDTTRSL